MKNNTLHQTNARLKFHLHRAFCKFLNSGHSDSNNSFGHHPSLAFAAVVSSDQQPLGLSSLRYTKPLSALSLPALISSGTIWHNPKTQQNEKQHLTPNQCPIKILFPSGITQNILNDISKKRWLSLRRAVWPTTTTRSLAPFACGAVRKSAVFFVSFFAAAQRKKISGWTHQPNRTIHRA